MFDLFRRLSKRRSCYHQTFGTEVGKWVLTDLATLFWMMGTTHVPGSTDDSAFNEGSRYVIHWIYSQLSTTADDVRARVDEHLRSGEFERD